MKDRDRFTAKDVHTAFYWISGTTLYERVQKGLCPVVTDQRGARKTSVFSRAGLVHVGVIDELSALGFLGGMVEFSPQDIDFFLSEYGRPPYRGRNKFKEMLRYYEDHRYDCLIVADLIHQREPGAGLKRRKRSPRYCRIRLYPDWSLFPNLGISFASELGASSQLGTVDIRDGIPTDCWSASVINVRKIWRDVAYRLGLDPDAV